MSEADKRLEEVGEAIYLASQADAAAKKDDDNLTHFEELFRQMHLHHRLQLQSEVHLRRPAHLEALESVDNPQDVVDKMLQATLKSEENSQIHTVCQKAIDVCQLSLILQSSKHKYFVK